VGHGQPGFTERCPTWLHCYPVAAMFEDVGIGQDARWLMIRGRWTLLTCRDGSYRWDDNRRTAPFELHMGNRRLDQVVIQFRRALGIGEISVQRAGLLAVFRRTSTLTATHAYRTPMRPASWATAWSVMASTSARCPQFCLHIHHEAGLGQLLLQLALLGHKAGDLLGLRVTARLRPRGHRQPGQRARITRLAPLHDMARVQALAAQQRPLRPLRGGVVLDGGQRRQFRRFCSRRQGLAA
jgi:hypothetical protein